MHYVMLFGVMLISAIPCLFVLLRVDEPTTDDPGRDGNGYPKPEYPTGFTRYEGGYGMISLPAGMLMGKNLYPLGRRVRVGTTHTRLPMGKIYPHQYNYNHLIESILAKIKPFSSYHLSRYKVM
jgi:hypothetical protein